MTDSLDVKPVDYDGVAAAYDRRYENRHYDGTRALLRRFIGPAAGSTIVEVGCGTGHWLAELEGSADVIVGVDLSWNMLERARTAAPSALLIRGDAGLLPLATACADRIYCVNALHHLRDPAGFLRECRRVLAPDGAFLTIGLDPHAGTDDWWVYDYFPSALQLDRIRYPSRQRIREMLNAAGFDGVTTEVAELLTGAVSFEAARARGSIDRRATSRLMVISDAEYEAGVARLSEEQPVLHTDIRLFATSARVSSHPPLRARAE